MWSGQWLVTELGTLASGVGLSGGVLPGTPAPGTAGSHQITITAMNRSGVSHQLFTSTVDDRRSPGGSAEAGRR